MKDVYPKEVCFGFEEKPTHKHRRMNTYATPPDSSKQIEDKNRRVKNYLKYLQLAGVLLIDMCSGLAYLECVEEDPRQTE